MSFFKESWQYLGCEKHNRGWKKHRAYFFAGIIPALFIYLWLILKDFILDLRIIIHQTLCRHKNAVFSSKENGIWIDDIWECQSCYKCGFTRRTNSSADVKAYIWDCQSCYKCGFTRRTNSSADVKAYMTEPPD